MADDTNLRGGQDRSRINMDQEHEVRYWAGKFGCTKQQLEQAVKQVGSSAERVREHLSKNRT